MPPEINSALIALVVAVLSGIGVYIGISFKTAADSRKRQAETRDAVAAQIAAAKKATEDENAVLRRADAKIAEDREEQNNLDRIAIRERMERLENRNSDLETQLTDARESAVNALKEAAELRKLNLQRDKEFDVLKSDFIGLNERFNRVVLERDDALALVIVRNGELKEARETIERIEGLLETQTIELTAVKEDAETMKKRLDELEKPKPDTDKLPPLPEGMPDPSATGSSPC